MVGFTKKPRPEVIGLVALLAVMAVVPPRLASGAARFQGSGGFTAAVPSGEFRDNLDKNGFGISGRIGWRPAGSLVILGVDGGFLVYGHESRREPFSTTIPDVTVDVTTDNNLVQAGGFLRLEPPSGPVRPYLDGLIGMNYFFTETKIKNLNGDEEVASSTNFHDSVLNYGGGGGLMFQLYHKKPASTPPGHGLESVMIDLGTRYVVGGRARYLKQGSIRRENGVVSYDVIESRTNLVTVQIGVALEF